LVAEKKKLRFFFFFFVIFIFWKFRGEVHRDGDYHRAVHVWIYSESTQELLLQRRADCKDSWPGQWDISSAGHISAGDSSLVSAQ
jgi:isopentenyldiphosphate isomerase